MISYVLLDVDDTILDFKKAERGAIEKTFRLMGIPCGDSIIKRYSEINIAQWERLERGELTRGETLVKRFEILFDEMGLTIPAEPAQALYENLLGIGHWFIDGAEEMLAALKGRYGLYIVSNGTASVQHSRLASAGIEPYFSGIFISEELGFNKPSKEFFDAALGSITGFEREKAIIVGDSLSSDILGGINAGIRTCWFNPAGKAGRVDIIPDHEIRSLAELPGLLEML